MSKSTLILHGSFGSPYENWFPWLHRVQTSQGGTCFVPSFPTPKNQNFETWARIVDAYFETGLLNEKSTLVTHSSSSVFAIKYLGSRKVSISKLVTVSGFNQFFSGNEDFDKINSEFFVPELELRTNSKYCGEIVCFFSNSDPHLPIDVLKSFAEAISGNIIDVPNGGHFNRAAGFTEFPQILEYI